MYCNKLFIRNSNRKENGEGKRIHSLVLTAKGSMPRYVVEKDGKRLFKLENTHRNKNIHKCDTSSVAV